MGFQNKLHKIPNPFTDPVESCEKQCQLNYRRPISTEPQSDSIPNCDTASSPGGILGSTRIQLLRQRKSRITMPRRESTGASTFPAARRRQFPAGALGNLRPTSHPQIILWGSNMAKSYLRKTRASRSTLQKVIFLVDIAGWRPGCRLRSLRGRTKRSRRQERLDGAKVRSMAEVVSSE